MLRHLWEHSTELPGGSRRFKWVHMFGGDEFLFGRNRGAPAPAYRLSTRVRDLSTKDMVESDLVARCTAPIPIHVLEIENYV